MLSANGGPKQRAARDDYQALIDYWKAESLRGSDREAACLEQVELLHAFCNKTKLLKSPFVDIRATASLLRLSVLPNLLNECSHSKLQGIHSIVQRKAPHAPGCNPDIARGITCTCWKAEYLKEVA